MKHLLIALGLMMPLLSVAQHTEGEITYTEITYLKKFMNWDEMSPERARRMKEFMPDSTANMKTLIFNKNEAVFTTVAKENEQAEYSQGRGGHYRMMQGMGANDITYQNIMADTMIEFKESMGKKFLIGDSRKDWRWKMTRDVKTILGYSCMKATHADSTDTVTAWFTTQIPVPVGPSKFGQLPGIILEINMGNGRYIMQANKVDIRPIEKGEIKEPKGGKVVTREEYEELMRKKREEMREMYGGKDGGKGHYRMYKH